MLVTYIAIGVVVVLLLAFAACAYTKAPPDMAYIISGMHKQPRILIGKAGFKLPFFERLDKLYLGAFQIDVKTSSSVPTAEFINVKIDSTVSVQVSQDPQLIQVAAQNFLNVDRDVIAARINDLLEGNLREITGTMRLTEMVSNRKAFSEKVQENAVPDLRRWVWNWFLLTFRISAMRTASLMTWVLTMLSRLRRMRRSQNLMLSVTQLSSRLRTSAKLMKPRLQPQLRLQNRILLWI